MENTVKQYERIILAFLNRHASYRIANANLENRVIADTENNHYQLMRIGWRRGRYVHFCPFHFAIKNGKIWILQNRTDVEVDAELEEMGVPKSDIVIGFLEPLQNEALGHEA